MLEAQKSSWPQPRPWPEDILTPQPPLIPISYPVPISIKDAYDRLKKEIQTDEAYAWSWHCNIAMAAYDEGIPHGKANKIADRFMQLAFQTPTKYPSTWPKEEEQCTTKSV